MSDFNTVPKGLRQIGEEEFMRIMFQYCIDQPTMRQIHGAMSGGESYDLRLFEVPNNLTNVSLGLAIKRNYWDAKTGKPTDITYDYCIYGTKEEWNLFQKKFASQFAGDNS